MVESSVNETGKHRQAFGCVCVCCPPLNRRMGLLARLLFTCGPAGRLLGAVSLRAAPKVGRAEVVFR